MIEETPAKDTFNVDETGLFYKCTPDKTLNLRATVAVGERIANNESLF